MLSSALYSKQDLLDVEGKLHFSVFMRIIGGFLSDVLLYAAFRYTNYSRAICIFFTNALMIPFFACCILKEKLLCWDIFAVMVGFGGMVLIV